MPRPGVRQRSGCPGWRTAGRCSPRAQSQLAKENEPCRPAGARRGSRCRRRSLPPTRSGFKRLWRAFCRILGPCSESGTFSEGMGAQPIIGEQKNLRAGVLGAGPMATPRSPLSYRAESRVESARPTSRGTPRPEEWNVGRRSREAVRWDGGFFEARLPRCQLPPPTDAAGSRSPTMPAPPPRSIPPAGDKPLPPRL